jgi:molybdate transport system ATP-binding protein
MTDTAPQENRLLWLENVALRLHERVLFRETNWRFEKGQHWAVIGGNGAGKSTLMRALCGRVPVVSGRIRYHFQPGARPAGKPPQDQIAYVSFGDQRDVLRRNDPYYQARWNAGVGEARITVGDYLSERNVAQLNPFQVAEQALDHRAFVRQRARVVELLGIEGLLAKELIQLSDGERRKTSIARALMQRPRLLILDNPLTGLDVAFKQRLTQIIERLMAGELPASPHVIVVTSRQDEIPPAVTHVLWVEHGQVVAQGPREEVLRKRQEALPTPAAHLDPIPPLPGDGRHTGETRSPTLIEMSRVNVSYHGVQVLQDVDWSVRRGEHWALLGANGAGKTTLLSLILGDHPQVYANDVRLFGRRRGSGESIWEIKKRIGWVAPELHLHYPRHVSSLQVVCSGFYDSIGLYRQSTPRQQQNAQAWLSHLGIQSLGQSAFARLSEGEQRLVLLARALVKAPELLILDEPCQGLDATNRARVRRTIEAVGRQQETSVVYVTHNPHELPSIITHFLELELGRVTASAPRTSPPTQIGAQE